MHTKVIDFQEISKPSFLAFLGLHVHPFLGCRLSCPLEGLISIHYPQGSENLFYSLLFFPFPLSALPRLLALTVGTLPNLRPTFLFSDSLEAAGRLRVYLSKLKINLAGRVAWRLLCL
jgi:hypothetical protein